MLFRRASSRARYREYRARQRDPNWAGMDTLEAAGQRPVRGKQRGRPFAVLFRAFWGMLRGNHGTLAGALATLTLATLIGLVVPSSTKIAIDFVILDSPGPKGIPDWVPGTRERLPLLFLVGGAMITLTVSAVGVGMWGRWQTTRMTRLLQAKMRRRAFAHASRLPLHRVQALKSGGLVSLLRDDAGAAAELLFSMIYNPWRAIVQLTGTLIVLAVVDWRMLMGGLALIPATWLTHRTWINRIRPVYRDIKVTRMSTDAHTTETFGGMRVVRGFSREPAEGVRFAISNHLMGRQEVLVWWWSRILEVSWAMLIPAASTAVLIYGGSRVINHTLSVGDVMMFTTYVLMLLSPMETLTNTAASVQNNLAGFDRVLDLLAEPLEFADLPATRTVNRASAKGRVELQNVSFAYPAAAKKGKEAVEKKGETTPGPAPIGEGGNAEPRLVLHEVSLTAEPGMTVALVGASGSGKTTLSNLVARFYDPTQGRILFDGVDLREIAVESYRQLLGIVEQEVFLFDGTIAENIAYGRRDATLESIRGAARAANADGFIAGLEHGYDTLIGERGVRLSGGQKQRIAIARALLADPVVLILDEATSNLDAESEALIQRSLLGLMRGRTSFVIAHRLSTIRHADMIVVLEKGRVVETGTHERLLASGGRYSELLRAQVEALDPAAVRG